MRYCIHCGQEVGEGTSSCHDCDRGLKRPPTGSGRQMSSGANGAELAGWVIAAVGSGIMIVAGIAMASSNRFSPTDLGFGFIGLGLFGIGIALLAFTTRAR